MTLLNRLHLGFVWWEALGKITKPKISSGNYLEKIVSHHGINLGSQVLSYFGRFMMKQWERACKHSNL